MSQHASSFSPCGKFFANISEDGKVKIWDVETNDVKHDYSTSIVHNSSCSCLTWVSLKHGLGKQSRRSSASGQHFLALGTSVGSVLIFSLSSGKVEHTLKGNGHMGAVLGIASDSATHLYTCGEDCKVILWDLEKGSSVNEFSTSNDRVSCLSVTTSGDIVTASRQVKLWKASTRQCMQTFTGHTSTVTHVKTFTTGEQEFAVTASKVDRMLSLWSLEGGKRKESCATFILDDLVATLDVDAHEEGVRLLAATRSGVVHFFEETLEKILASAKPLKARWRVSVIADDRKTAESLPVVAGKFAGSVILAYGGAGCLRFESVTLKREEPHEILIRDDPRKVKKGKDVAGKRAVADLAKVDYALGGEVKKSVKTAEIPMEKRLENLALSKDQPAGQITPAKNMHYLIQALQSRDQAVLQDVLLTKDKNSVRSTLKYLPPQFIRPLVEELTGFMRRKMRNCECATIWMRALIELHAGQMMAIGAEDLREQMRPFLGIVEHRVHNLQALTRARGRLDLILAQIRGNCSVDRDEIAKISQNLIVHRDQASDSESEIGLDEQSDNESWEDESGESDESEEVDEKMDVSE
ncbi:WD repeat-containing protein 43 [Phlebotomus argentipes]|uniref:WD repeat-containing protein 43 n=1 Tax=Phlebotomus argentipes TaxID=94469 RepID=UPI00289366BA|nr:WD repeat-containing protein 43 [Phlebotomus argentipes]